MQVSSIIKRSKAWIQTKVCSRNHGGTLSAGSVMACSYPKLCLISFLKHTKFTYLDGVLPTVGISLLHHLKFKTIPQCHTHKPIWLKLSYILASFNMTVHGIKCTISKQKSDKFLVNATICAKFWRGEGINMTLEKITADVHLFSPFLLWSHLKLVLLFFSSLVAWCLWQLYGCSSYLLLSQPYQSEDGGKMKAVPSAHTLVRKCW